MQALFFFQSMRPVCLFIFQCLPQSFFSIQNFVYRSLLFPRLGLFPGLFFFLSPPFLSSLPFPLFSRYCELDCLHDFFFSLSFVCRKTTNFCVLILLPAILMKLFISCINFWCSFQGLLYKNHIICKYGYPNFFFYFYNLFSTKDIKLCNKIRNQVW